ncbi:MAG: N-acetyltransferase [Planctomycetes bacterium]|nr:N-acetyltransferase [Planctomycetota bacterium]NOG55511.1 GNAT family N-acetyltransferase [Planctomycetota bacterium]
MSDQAAPSPGPANSNPSGERGPVLTGQRLRIRPIEWDDLGHVCRWWNDARVMREVRAERFSVTLEQLQSEYWPAWRDQKPEGPGRCQCIIEFPIRAGAQPIGEIGWSLEQGTEDSGGEVHVHIKVCEPSLWGQGYGREALRLLVSYLSDHPTLSAYPIIGEPGDWNARCHRMLEQCGFVKVGAGRFTGNAWCEPCAFIRYRHGR